MRIFLFSLCFVLFGFNHITYGQTFDSFCARTLPGLGVDSLIWDATPCVDFEGYIIFSSSDANTGFIPLDTITDATQLSYINTNPSEQTLYYQLGMLCNGIISVSSITLSNDRPITPNLQSVSIVNDIPVLSWDASSSPEVIGYQIYKESPYGSGNFFPYPNSGTIVTNTFFEDTNSPDLLVRYAIVAISACNKSLLGEGTDLDGTTGPHTSMAITAAIDPCTQTATLNWNAYENWAQGVSNYEVIVEIDGQTPFVAAMVEGTQNSYAYTDLEDGQNVTFQVRALENGGINEALSNTISIQSIVNKPVEYTQITDLNVQADNSVSLEWLWDVDADFDSAQLLIKDTEGALIKTIELDDLQATSYLETSQTPDNNRVAYQVQTIDACAQRVLSPIWSTTYLEGNTTENYIDQLQWQPPLLDNGTITGYNVYKIINNQTVLVGQTIAGTTALEVAVNTQNVAEAEACYFVETQIEYTDHRGINVATQSQSNQICLKQQAIVYTPNALAPRGKNRYFRPVIVFGAAIQSYQLQIFDRYGGLIFETQSIEDAWDGSSKNGDTLPQGMYVFIINITQPNGSKLQEKGTIMLIH